MKFLFSFINRHLKIICVQHTLKLGKKNYLTLTTKRAKKLGAYFLRGQRSYFESDLDLHLY